MTLPGRVILTSAGDAAAALALMRSLGRRGVAVSVLADDAGAAVFRSRYCAERLVTPPAEAAAEWLAFVAAVVRARSYDALVPCDDDSAYLLSEGRHDLQAHVQLSLPSPEAFRTARDKHAILGVAAECGVPTPLTVFPHDAAEARDLAPVIGYPLVVKGHGGAGSGQVRFAGAPDELETRFLEVQRIGGSPPMLQELVQGEGLGYGAVLCDGEPHVEFQWRRLREYPSAGGPSALAVSIDDRETAAAARRLLARLQWTGIAMVEFKRDSRGRARLMEVNPRAWGSIELALRCGVDVAGAYLALRQGRPREAASPPRYRVGRRLSLLFPRGIARALSGPRGIAELLADGVRADTWLDVHPDDLGPVSRQLREARWLARAAASAR